MTPFPLKYFRINEYTILTKYKKNNDSIQYDICSAISFATTGM
jgi:hypothetical protein